MLYWGCFGPPAEAARPQGAKYTGKPPGKRPANAPANPRQTPPDPQALPEASGGGPSGAQTP